MEERFFQTLMDPQTLYQHLGDPGWRVVDCRFKLADVEGGRRDYHQAHIQGAVYAHLEEDLSGPKIPGISGRHPLPSVERAAQVFSRLGIQAGIQVVAYDDAGGALAASRLWWMLRWLGHNAVAVLDGGWQAWLANGGPKQQDVQAFPLGEFVPIPNPGMIATTQDVDDLRSNSEYRLFDARSLERYLGRNETIDPIAGHIPGATSAPYVENLSSDGRFMPEDALRQHYQDLLGNLSPERSIFYCGSGVSAIHDILAMEHVGLNGARLYVGSWSEWITDQTRPISVNQP